MSQLTDDVEALRVDVEDSVGAMASGITFIEGVPALIEAALAAGAPPAVVQAVKDMNALLKTKTAAFKAALAGNPGSGTEPPPV